jgi:hypothetical protein
MRPSQHVVDLNWAARKAGRRLGIRVVVNTKVNEVAFDEEAEVRVTPVVRPG